MSFHRDSKGSFCGLNHAGVILPSLLAADFGNLERDIRALERSGASVLHLDVMDGHFVPNLSIGIPVVEAVRRATELVLDVHLMLSHPGEYVEAFRKAGADALTFHVEALADETVPGQNFARNGLSVDAAQRCPELRARVSELLARIRGLGAACGLSIIPPTSVEVLSPWLSECDNVLVMSVMPGFGGQRFDSRSLGKLSWLRGHAPETVLRSIDGGVNEENISIIAEHGGNGLVMGTAIFRSAHVGNQFQKLMEELRGSNSDDGTEEKQQETASD